MRFQLETVGTPPSHWKCVRNKTLFRGIDDRSDGGSEELLTVSHLTGVTRRSEKDVYMFMADSLEGYKRCQPGDLVINTMWAWMGALGISPHHGVVSPSYHVYRPAQRGMEPRYFDYLFHTKAYVAEITRNSRGVWTSRLRLYPDVFLDMESLLPPPAEQVAIAEFLDRKTATIDALIEKKERLVELLAEKRAAVIHQAVTKGLDPTAPMKDSGVPWFGQIPAHWEIKRLRHLLRRGLQNGLFKKRDQFGKGVLLVNVSDIYSEDHEVDFGNLERVETSEAELRSFGIREGDIFFVRSSLKLEGVAVSALLTVPSEPMVFECHLVGARPDRGKVDPSFLVNYMNSSLTRQRLIALATTTTMTTIAQDRIADIPVPIPPIAEQQAIASHVSEVHRNTATTTKGINSQIRRLHEYRQSLITAAVTGQINVRSDSIAGEPPVSTEEVIA